jgi:hypothetical protein
MTSLLVPSILLLIAICIKLSIDAIGLILTIQKDKKLIIESNELEKKYQLIKNLY